MGHMGYDEMMHGALELAKRAAAAGDVPVGAVVVDADGQIIGRGYNTREADGDPLAHAANLAMRMRPNPYRHHRVWRVGLQARCLRVNLGYPARSPYWSRP